MFIAWKVDKIQSHSPSSRKCWWEIEETIRGNQQISFPIQWKKQAIWIAGSRNQPTLWKRRWSSVRPWKVQLLRSFIQLYQKGRDRWTIFENAWTFEETRRKQEVVGKFVLPDGGYFKDWEEQWMRKDQNDRGGIFRGYSEEWSGRVVVDLFGNRTIFQQVKHS